MDSHKHYNVIRKTNTNFIKNKPIGLIIRQDLHSPNIENILFEINNIKHDVIFSFGFRREDNLYEKLNNLIYIQIISMIQFTKITI